MAEPIGLCHVRAYRCAVDGGIGAVADRIVPYERKNHMSGIL